MAYTTDRFDERVIEILRRGGVGLAPSDTIYGLSARALDEKAVKKLHQLKDRDEHKPFIVLIASLKMLNLLSIDRQAAKPAAKYWPGGFTLICAAPQAPRWLTLGTKTLAIRIPDNQPLIKLIDKVGPLVSTSANKQDQEPFRTADAAKQLFGEALDFYVDAGQIHSPPSTIARLVEGKLEIMRQGAVKINQEETR